MRKSGSINQARLAIFRPIVWRFLNCVEDWKCFILFSRMLTFCSRIAPIEEKSEKKVKEIWISNEKNHSDGENLALFSGGARSLSSKSPNASWSSGDNSAKFAFASSDFFS